MNRKLFLLVIVLLAAIALPAAWVAADPAATSTSFIPGEPNDTFATAIPIPLNHTIEGYFLTTGDLDYYRVDLPPGDDLLYVNVSASGYQQNPEPQPVGLMLYDGSHTLIAERACDAYTDLSVPADAGTYYLLVQRCPGPLDIDSPYLLSVYWSPDSDDHSPGDVEPNDTPAQAETAAYGDSLRGWISDTDTVDHYRFAGQSGDQIALPIGDVAYKWNAEIVLYDPAMNPIPMNFDTWTYWGALPMTGSYTLAVTVPGADYDDGFIDYDLTLELTDGDEPNNTMASATDVMFGPELNVVHDYLCDTDWFRFQGSAGDVLASMNTNVVDENVFLYAANGSYLDAHVLPTDGVYYLKVLGNASDKWDTWCFEGSITYDFGEALWVSAAVDGLGGNAAIKRGDIATRKTAANQWQIVFDASDVGITQNVTAFERMPNGSILMSLAAAQTISGLGKVMPQDIIRFLPTTLGDTTVGTFQWFLDGSDVGLTTAGEKIDAISMQADVTQPLRVSIAGGGSVPRQSGGALKVADEDIINFVATAYGANSAGSWRVSLDGSTVPGMATEDVTAMTRVEMFPQRDSQTLLSFDSGFTINGQQGTTFDVMYMDSWRTAVQHLTDKKIDGLAVGPAWTP